MIPRASETRTALRSIRGAVLASSAAVLAVAGCTGGGAAPTFTIPVLSPAAVASPSPSLAAPQTVTFVLREYSITPATVTIKAGTPVTFVVQNGGTIDHAFVLSGGGVSLATKDLAFQPGTSEQIAATLAPGTYTYLCPVDGHAGLGMKGTLTVTP